MTDQPDHLLIVKGDDLVAERLRDETFHRFATLCSRGAAGAVIIIGCLVILGWLLNVPFLKGVLPGFVAMKANTALALIAAGIGCWMASMAPPRLWTTRLGWGAASFTCLIGLLSLIEYASGINLGIDELLFRDEVAMAGVVRPGLMAVATAANCVLFAAALLLLDIQIFRKYSPSAFLTHIVAVVALVSLTGYLYGAAELYGAGLHSPLAVHTAAAFLVLAVSLLLARPNQGLTAIALSQTLGGLMIRRLLPSLTVLLLGCGWLLLLAHEANLLDVNLMTALLMVIGISVAGGLVLWNGEMLHHADLKRLRAEEEVKEVNHIQARRVTERTAELEGRTSELGEEAILRKSAEQKAFRLAAIVECAHDAIIGKTLDLIITSWNKGAERLYGYTAEEMIGKNLAIIVPDEHRAELTKIMKMVAAGKHIEHLETTRVRKDGSRVDVSISLSPIRCADGNIIEVACIGRDITERRRLQALLGASEVEYRRLFEAAKDGILILDAVTGQIDDVNQFLIDLLGYTKSEFLTKKLWEIGLFQDVDASKHAFARSQQEDSVRYEDFPIVAKNGHTTDVEFVSNTYVVGERKRIQCNIRDISERVAAETARQRLTAVLHASELEYRRLFESAKDGILILDAATGQINDVNQFLIDLLGYGKEELLGKKLWEIGLFQDVADCKNGFAKLQQEDYVRHEDLPIVTKTGRSVDVEFVSNKYRFDGNQKRIQCNIRDITERVRADATLRGQQIQIQQLNAELEQRVKVRTAELEVANKELEAFAYSVSHDLRAPLRAIDGFVHLLQESTTETPPEKRQHYLQMLVDNARQMSRLIDDLLRFSRTSRQSVQLATIGTEQLVRQCLVELQPEHEGRHVEIQVGDLPECWGDGSLLKQIWFNLLSNALKYTRKRDPARIEIGSENKDGETVYFVRDNGVGFDMQYANILFGVFQRLHSAEEYEGTGIGLALVQRILHRHGGRIWTDAKLDQGATFFFTLGRRSVHA